MVTLCPSPLCAPLPSTDQLPDKPNYAVVLNPKNPANQVQPVSTSSTPQLRSSTSNTKSLLSSSSAAIPTPAVVLNPKDSANQLQPSSSTPWITGQFSSSTPTTKPLLSTPSATSTQAVVLNPKDPANPASLPASQLGLLSKSSTKPLLSSSSVAISTQAVIMNPKDLANVVSTLSTVRQPISSTTITIPLLIAPTSTLKYLSLQMYVLLSKTFSFFCVYTSATICASLISVKLPAAVCLLVRNQVQAPTQAASRKRCYLPCNLDEIDMIFMSELLPPLLLQPRGSVLP